MKRVVAAALLLLTSTAFAAPPDGFPEGFHSYGAGTTECGEWVVQREAVDGKPALLRKLQWVLGYLTAVSELGQYEKPVHRLRYAEPDSVMVAIDNYCKAHPTQLFINAAQDVQRQLEH
jgi:hypothetical protein